MTAGKQRGTRAQRPEVTAAVTPQHFGVEDRVRVMRHGLASMLGPVLTGLVGLVLVPVMLTGLGSELYGVWVMVLTVVTGCAAVADMGIHLAVVREVAASGAEGESDEAAARFVATAATLYLALAIAAALAVAGTGLVVSRLPSASPDVRAAAPRVFAVAAVGSVFSQMFYFQRVVLQGLTRFDLSALLSAASAVTAAVGTAAVLALGGRLTAIVVVQAAVAAFFVVVGDVTVTTLRPRLRTRPGCFDWATVRPRLRFSGQSQLVVLAGSAVWEGLALLVGAMRGPAALVPFHLGRRFPSQVSSLVWDGAAVMMPVASMHERAGDLPRAAEALEAGTRWVVVSSLPSYLILWIAGPRLLEAWLGRAPGDAVAVLRLLTAAAMTRALGEAAASTLWGRGAVRVLLAVACAEAAAVLALAGWLLGRAGVRGAAWAVVLATPVATAAVLGTAAHACGLSPAALVRRAASRLWLPVALCVAATALSVRLGTPRGWPGVLAAAAAGGGSYLLAFWNFSAHEEERMFISRGLARISDVVYGVAAVAYRGARVGTRALGIRASRHPRLAAVVEAITEPYERAQVFERQYAAGPDHWGYTTNPIERARFRLALEMLDQQRGGRRLGRVFEIACAEGVFTEMLAPRCDALLAVDFSETAVARARARCAHAPHVSIGCWNLRTDPIPGRFDVIVVMDVLTLIRRPDRLRRVIQKLVDGMQAGSLLLACDYREEESLRALETSWVGRRLLFGGKWVIEALAGHPALETVRRAGTETHVLALFRKV